MSYVQVNDLNTVTLVVTFSVFDSYVHGLYCLTKGQVRGKELQITLLQHVVHYR